MLPNYKDLGFIFGDATNGGIQSDPHQDKDLDDDILGIKAGMFQFSITELGLLILSQKCYYPLICTSIGMSTIVYTTLHDVVWAQFNIWFMIEGLTISWKVH